MKESPLFVRMKKSGKGAKNPIKESFGNWYNLKFVLIALFGATAGQGVVWYTGQFYALTFMQKSLSVDFVQTNYIIGIALLIATPFFVMMGSLSDKIGRKPIILTGCVLAVIFYLPIFHGLSDQADLSKKTLVSEVAKGEAVVKLHEKADPALGVVDGDHECADVFGWQRGDEDGDGVCLCRCVEGCSQQDGVQDQAGHGADGDLHRAGCHAGHVRDDGVWAHRGVLG
jgi:hypothetical protein